MAVTMKRGEVEVKSIGTPERPGFEAPDTIQHGGKVWSLVELKQNKRVAKEVAENIDRGEFSADLSPPSDVLVAKLSRPVSVVLQGKQRYAIYEHG